MKTNITGSTSLQFTELSMGCAGLGNLFNEVSDVQALETVLAALENGMGYFDVAPHYGGGLAEKRLGMALQQRSNARPIISTKVGKLVVPIAKADMPIAPEFVNVPGSEKLGIKFDYSYEGIKKSFNDSCHRLGVNRIEILLVHDLGKHGDKKRHRLDEKNHWRQITDGGGFQALMDLKKEGLIDAFGLGAMDEEIPLKVINAGIPIEYIMYANRYNLLEHSTALTTLLPECQSRGILILNGGVFATGCLAGGKNYMYSDKVDLEIRQKIEKIDAACLQHGVGMKNAAVEFALSHPSVVTACIGMSSPQEVIENASLAKSQIPQEFWKHLKREDIIDPRAPICQ